MEGDSRDEPIRLTATDPLDGLTSWLADARVDAAAAERARQRSLERQAAEEATVVGTLADLAERGSAVTVTTIGGHVARGPLSALGADFVAVREPGLGDVVVPLRSVGTVRAAAGEDPVVGDRATDSVIALAAALVEIAADRPSVVVSAAGEEIRGELRSAGSDVVAVGVDTDRSGTLHREMIYVALHAIDHLVLLAN